MAVLEVITTSAAVRSVADAIDDFGTLFGVTPAFDVETIGEPPIQSAFAAFRMSGGGAFSLMESSDEAGPIARFLERRGEGVFSISLRVDDLDAVSQQLLAQGQDLVLPEPREFRDAIVGGRRIPAGRLNFVRPSPKTHGILFELVEYPDA
jgi:hypothetical protein